MRKSQLKRKSISHRFNIKSTNKIHLGHYLLHLMIYENGEIFKKKITTHFVRLSVGNVKSETQVQNSVEALTFLFTRETYESIF